MVIVDWGRHSKSLKIELFKKVSQEILLRDEGMKREREKNQVTIFQWNLPSFFASLAIAQQKLNSKAITSLQVHEAI